VQLTELLFQNVKDLPGQGQLALKPGYVAVVSKAASLRVALTATLCPAPDDQKRLMDGAGPTRVGVGLTGGDGSPYRLLRELGGNRQLLRMDAATKKFAPVTEDQLEIDSFLRVECGMPPSDAYTGFFVIEINELPSLRGKAAAAASEAYVDQPRVKALKEELEATKKFEGMQDRLFKVAQRLHDLNLLGEKLKDAEAGVAAVETELARSPWTPQQIKELTAKATRVKEDLKKRDDALNEVAKKRQRASQNIPPPADPFLTDPWFYGGFLGGALLDGLAFLLKRPFIALFGLLPFLAALVAVLRWIEADEADKQAAALIKELKEREFSVKRTYEEEQAPLKAALKAAGTDSAGDLLSVFRERELVTQRREAARAKLDEVKKDPDVSRLAVEVPLLESEKAKLEEQVQQMGFSRPVGEIEGDIKHAMGISASLKSAAVPEAEVPKHLLDRAAELLNLSSDELWAQLQPRFLSYLGALTDKRVATATRESNGLLVLAAPDGRSGPYTGLPPPLRDLVYVALRLALLERVGGYKRLPVVIDDAFGTFDPAKRALIGKMLKGISTQTQVIHRVAEAPPAGTADVVLTP
jgi:hypothetical protein